MSEKQLTSNPKGICEKLFNAFSVNPPFRTIRRISHHPQTPAPPPVSLNYNSSTLGGQRQQSTPRKTEHGTQLGHSKNKPPNILAAKALKSKVGRVNSKTETDPTHVLVTVEGKPKPKVVLVPPQEVLVAVAAKPTKSDVVLKGEPKPPPEIEIPVTETGRKMRSYSINGRAADYIAHVKSKLRSTTMGRGAGD